MNEKDEEIAVELGFVPVLDDDLSVKEYCRQGVYSQARLFTRTVRQYNRLNCIPTGAVKPLSEDLQLFAEISDQGTRAIRLLPTEDAILHRAEALTALVEMHNVVEALSAEGFFFEKMFLSVRFEHPTRGRVSVMPYEVSVPSALRRTKIGLLAEEYRTRMKFWR